MGGIGLLSVSRFLRYLNRLLGQLGSFSSVSLSQTVARCWLATLHKLS